MLIKNNNKITALYFRLSNDDGNQGDSDSIINQKEMLLKYAQNNGLSNIQEFCDDGYSGIDFDNRPAFNRMIELVESGDISTIIVKDLSRLGREYIKMGMFLEIIFPRYNVRFIAINDNIDSNKGEDDFLPFKSLFNEFHVRDTSRKVRAVKDMQARQGKRSNGSVPYGYVLDKTTNMLTVNQTTAPIIKKIFEMCVSGLGPSRIASVLTDEGIPTPLYKGRWSESSIARILESKEYIGHTVTKKSYVLSYKQKKRIYNDIEEQLIFENTHDAIIDEEMFNIVQKLRKHKKRPTKMGEQSILSGLVYCADCGASHYLVRGTTIPEYKFSYNCSTYRNKSKVRACTPHSIRITVLEKLILESVNQVIRLIVTNENVFAEKLMTNSLKIEKTDLSKKQKDLEKSKARTKELDQLISKLFEQHTLGNLSEERFLKMSKCYEEEQKSLDNSITKVEKELTNTNKLEDVNKFIKIAKKYINLQNLDDVFLNELIEKIVVYEKSKSDSTTKRTQRVDIYFNFIGAISLG